MLTPPRWYSRGNGESEAHSPLFITEKTLRNYKNKVLFLILLGVALLGYGMAFAYMK